MKRNHANESFWVEDARLSVEYVNDPTERAKLGVTIDDRGILFSDENEDGARISPWLGEIVLRCDPDNQ